MGKGQARQATALQILHQEEAMEQPPTNSRAHGGAGQHRVHRHPTPFTAAGGSCGHRGEGLRLHGDTAAPDTTTTATGGTTRVPNATKSSDHTDEPGRNAGAPRCNPATADAGAAAS